MVSLTKLAEVITEQLRKAEHMNEAQRTACRIGVISIAYSIADDLSNAEADALMTACGL